jgi:hypothetical protein
MRKGGRERERERQTYCTVLTEIEGFTKRKRKSRDKGEKKRYGDSP